MQKDFGCEAGIGKCGLSQWRWLVAGWRVHVRSTTWMNALLMDGVRASTVDSMIKATTPPQCK